MSEARVKNLLPKFIKYAQKRGMDLEVLFHPGYITEDENTAYSKSVKFRKFYLSPGRRREYDAARNINGKQIKSRQ